MYTCKDCQKECPTYEFLRKHCGRIHKIHSSRVWIEYMNGGLSPTCKCGCGDIVRWRAGSFQTYINGHNARGETNPMFGKHHAEDTKTNISTKRKEKFAKGEYRIWQHEDTEETRVRQAKINASITKEANPERAKKISAALKGKTHSNEHMEKLWAGQRRWLAARHYNEPSGIEVKMRNMLDVLGIQYNSQFEIDRFTFDFYLPNTNTLIEVDGDFYHSNPIKYHTGPEYPIQEHNQKNDINKTNSAKDHGYQLLRFWESDINDHPDQVIRTLLNTIADNK